MGRVSSPRTMSSFGANQKEAGRRRARKSRKQKAESRNFRSVSPRSIESREHPSSEAVLRRVERSEVGGQRSEIRGQGWEEVSPQTYS